MTSNDQPTFLESLLVAIALIAIFLAAYLLLRRVLDAIVSRTRWQPQVQRPLVIGLRYIFFLMSTLAVMAQLGVNPELLAAVGRAAMIALLFYVAWATVTRVLLTLLERYQMDRSIEQLIEGIKEGLDAAGIEIPFPHLQLFIDDAKGLKPVLQPFYPMSSKASAAD